MAAVFWTRSFLCLLSVLSSDVAGGHPSSAPPLLCPTLVVPAGQNTSLSCSLMSCTGITWYLLRADQLQPLLTLMPSRMDRDTVDYYEADASRVNSAGSLEGADVRLEILEVQEEDAGLYFCTGRCAGAVIVNRGVHLVVGGVGEDSAKPPCWRLGVCLLPALIVLCVVAGVGCCLYSGRAGVCCCDSARGDTSRRFSKAESLHYSSLKLADKPRPSGQRGTGLVEENVVYSSVTKNPTNHR